MSIGLIIDEAVAKLIVRETRLDDMELKTNNTLVTQDYKKLIECHKCNELRRVDGTVGQRKCYHRTRKKIGKISEYAHKCGHSGHNVRFCNKTTNKQEDNRETVMFNIPTAQKSLRVHYKTVNGYWALGQLVICPTREITFRI